MKVEKVVPANAVQVYVESVNAIYMRHDSPNGIMWYKPDMETLSLKLLMRDNDEQASLEAAYQKFIKAS